MSASLKDIEEQLQRDRGSPEAEWDVINTLLKQSESEADTILKWVFAQYKGYTETRARAGFQFLQNNPAEGWHILERLVSSSDPDDRDTALAVLAALHDINAAQLAKPLLNDPTPYLQLDAAEFLWEFFPSEVNACLEKLIEHEVSWVSCAARELLPKLKRKEDTNAGIK